MKKMQLMAIVSALILSGCYYPHKVFKGHTGLEFGKEVNLCPSSGVRDQKTCEPTSDGWRKANKVTPATLESGEVIFKRVENDYLLQMLTGNQKTIIHNYNLWGSDLNNPKSNIIITKLKIKEVIDKSKELFADYIVEPYGHVYMSEIYEKKAVTNAITELNTQAKLNDIKLDAEFVINVENELKKNLKNSQNATLTYHHIIAEYIGEMANGDDDEKLKEISALSKTVSKFNEGKEIITGISGILFSNFTSTQDVVESSMLTTAIDASLHLAPSEQIKKIENIKVSVSTKWSNQVNEDINTSLRTIDNGIFFFPLWIKTATIKK
jgi:hypothetical protein